MRSCPDTDIDPVALRPSCFTVAHYTLRTHDCVNLPARVCFTINEIERGDVLACSLHRAVEPFLPYYYTGKRNNEKRISIATHSVISRS